MPSFFTDSDIRLDDFARVCAQTTHLDDYPMAHSVAQNILIYHGDTVRQAIQSPDQEMTLKSELCRALKEGPGILVIQGAYQQDNDGNIPVIDRTTELFRRIIRRERQAGHGKGDHFGGDNSGSGDKSSNDNHRSHNERIWNSLQKACLEDPELFMDYYKNPCLHIVCEAWLGPCYQMTAQMNNVKPGGQPQSVHRDYHLGFQPSEVVRQFPVHMQVAAQYWTLQGAVAHVDMPVEMGPTLLLPYSHQYEPGYLAYKRDDFAAYFDEHHSQVPLDKGDVVFFSPAIFHGAGGNTTTDKDRFANLIQISSAFGKPMETRDTRAMVDAVYPVLLARCQEAHDEDGSTNIGIRLTEREIRNVLTTVADAYAFPTNLDTDLPVNGGVAPESEYQLVHRALQNQWSPYALQMALDDYSVRRSA